MSRVRIQPVTARSRSQLSARSRAFSGRRASQGSKAGWAHRVRSAIAAKARAWARAAGRLPGVIVAVEPGGRGYVVGAEVRPPTVLYSTRSGPRAARSQSAAQRRASSYRLPSSAAAGPRMGKRTGANSGRAT